MKIKNELIHTVNISVKLLFFCGLIFFVSGRLVAGEKDSVIERIWERIINYNSEVMSARRNEEIAGINQDYYWLSFLPAVSISSSPVFSDISSVPDYRQTVNIEQGTRSHRKPAKEPLEQPTRSHRNRQAVHIDAGLPFTSTRIH